MSSCSRCGAEITWLRTAKRDKAMPLDAEPTPTGTVIVRDDGRAVVLDIPDRDLALEQGAQVCRPSFASFGARR